MSKFRSVSLRLAVACVLAVPAVSLGAKTAQNGGGGGTASKPLGAVSSAVKPGTNAKPGTQAKPLGGISSAVKPLSAAKPGTSTGNRVTGTLIGTQTKPLGGISSAVKPGTQTPGTQTPGTQTPGTQTPGTSTRGKALGLGTQAASTQAVPQGGHSALSSALVPASSHTAPPSSSAPRTASTGRFRTLVPRINGTLPKLSSKEPGLLVVMADLSYSMNGEFAGQQKISKAHALADAVNGTLLEFVDHMNVGGEIKPRLDVILRGYGKTTRSLFGGPLAGKDVASITELADNPVDEIDIDDGQGNTVPQPIWVRPVGEGDTPMRSMFSGMKGIVGKWARRPSGRHLVLGVHVTDGESTDGDPLPEIASLAQQVQSSGGELLMTNIHLSSKGSPGQAVIFPDENDAAGFDEFGKRLFEASSPVPPDLAEQLHTKPGARMMAYNAKPDQFAKVFKAGSSAAAQ